MTTSKCMRSNMIYSRRNNDIRQCYAGVKRLNAKVPNPFWNYHTRHFFAVQKSITSNSRYRITANSGGDGNITSRFLSIEPPLAISICVPYCRFSIFNSIRPFNAIYPFCIRPCPCICDRQNRNNKQGSLHLHSFHSVFPSRLVFSVSYTSSSDMEVSEIDSSSAMDVIPARIISTPF